MTQKNPLLPNGILEVFRKSFEVKNCEISVIFIFGFSIVLSALSFQYYPWGYDEYGAVVTHLELDDPHFRAQYLKYFNAICSDCSLLAYFFETYLLPIFVVPIRWTYALGISPWLGTARLLDLDWPELKPLLLFPNIVLATVGLWLVKFSTKVRGAGEGAQLTFLALIFASHPLIWWLNTFTSYANHIICFGAICYATLSTDNIIKGRIFSRSALLLSSVCLLNYQYIPVVTFLGLADLLRRKRSFFVDGFWRGWIAPAAISFGSLLFLMLRADISGLHGDPTYAALSGNERSLFHFPTQATDVISGLKTLTNQYVGILKYFFMQDGNYLMQFNLYECLWISVLFFLFAFFSWITLDRKIIVLVFSTLFPTVILHVTGVLPLSPSRHQLVMLLPLSLLVACIIERIFSVMKVAGSLKVIGVIFASVSLLSQAHIGLERGRTPPSKEIDFLLQNFDVERLVLAPCDFEPLLYPDVRARFDPIYRCGPRVIKKLPSDTRTIAVWSSFKELSNEDASRILADFSANEWIFSSVPTQKSLGTSGILLIGRLVRDEK